MEQNVLGNLKSFKAWAQRGTPGGGRCSAWPPVISTETKAPESHQTTMEQPRVMAEFSQKGSNPILWQLWAGFLKEKDFSENLRSHGQTFMWVWTWALDWKLQSGSHSRVLGIWSKETRPSELLPSLSTSSQGRILTRMSSNNRKPGMHRMFFFLRMSSMQSALFTVVKMKKYRQTPPSNTATIEYKIYTFNMIKYNLY